MIYVAKVVNIVLRCVGSMAYLEAYRTAFECSLVWQWRKRSSLSVLVKAYLPDMVSADLRLHQRRRKLQTCGR